MFLYHVAHVSEFNTGFDLVNSFLQTFPCVCDEFFGLFFWSAHKKCFIQVTVIASVVNSHINITNITILERSKVRYTMTNHFIYRCTTTLRKLIIIQWRRVTIPINCSFVNCRGEKKILDLFLTNLKCIHTYSINFVCCNTNCNRIEGFIQDFST